MIRRYRNLALAAGVTDASSAILNFFYEKKEFLCVAIVKQSHFKFIHVPFFWRSFSTQFNFHIISFRFQTKINFD